MASDHLSQLSQLSTSLTQAQAAVDAAQATLRRTLERERGLESEGAESEASDRPVGFPRAIVTATELHKRLPDVLERARAGECLRVEWHGRVVAVLVPPELWRRAQLALASIGEPLPEDVGGE